MFSIFQSPKIHVAKNKMPKKKKGEESIAIYIMNLN